MPLHRIFERPLHRVFHRFGEQYGGAVAPGPGFEGGNLSAATILAAAEIMATGPGFEGGNVSGATILAIAEEMAA